MSSAVLGLLGHATLWKVSAPERTAPESEAEAQIAKRAALSGHPSVKPGAHPTQRASGAGGSDVVQPARCILPREEKLEAVAEHLEVDWPPSFVMRECAMLFVFAGGR